ncbi:uncharacterized protein LOC142537266 [Primulina tabacum]|uniref:uncharacterized protein LOC142537266 n=1 Tax=Primulina tabacum TaxID=48773 RepID=UPI003F5998A4
MDVQKGLLPLNWTYFHQEKSMDDWRQSLLLNMELEEELRIRDEQIAQLREMLHVAIKERDEAQEKCQNVFFEKILIQQKLNQSAPISGVSSVEEDDPRKGIEFSNVFSSSDCDESIVSSPPHFQPPPAPPQPAEEVEAELPILLDRPLPEKGKLLQAVMKAGPLLQTLLLAGPLPRWRQPPPPLDTNQIPPPPVVIPSSPTPLPTLLSSQSSLQNNILKVNRKRGLSENPDSSPIELKYQKGFLQSPLMS